MWAVPAWEEPVGDISPVSSLVPGGPGEQRGVSSKAAADPRRCRVISSQSAGARSALTAPLPPINHVIGSPRTFPRTSRLCKLQRSESRTCMHILLRTAG